MQVNALTSQLITTAQVLVKNKNKTTIKCRAILDTGAAANFISESLCEKLQLPKIRCSIPVSGINKVTTISRSIVKLTFSSIYNNYERTLEFLSIPAISEYVPYESIPRDKVSIPGNIRLADPTFYKSDAVDLLLSTGPTLSLFKVGQIHLHDNNTSIYLQKTSLGWVVGGSIDTPKHSRDSNHIVCNFNNLEDELRKFWEIEEVKESPRLSIEEMKCEELFTKNHTRNAEGRYVVGLPFKTDPTTLGKSKSMATKRLYGLFNRFKTNIELRNEYHKIINEYIKLGHMSEIKDEKEEVGYYMPHHAVVKESSLTTKVRVVFDASAKTSTGISLNDILMTGAKIQDDSISLILRFRSHNYVLTADIEKMYRQFLVQEKDRKYQKILWMKNDKIKVFQLNTVTFGVTSAPFLAIRCLKQLATDYEDRFPIASKILKNDLYVDDVLTGASSIEEARQIKMELNKLLEMAQLHLRQWASNEPTLLDDLDDKSINANIQLNKDATIKTLGLYWKPNDDTINYSISVSDPPTKVTKRSILSSIARIFDPIGLLGPVILKAKIFMQSLWKEKIDWDESVSILLFTEWQKYYSQLKVLNNISFHRKFLLTNSKYIELHGFCDASRKGFGACIYVKSIDDNNEVFTSIVCSKSRVAPLKQVDIHRLELCGALLLSKLYHQVINSMSIKWDKVFLWSDSEVTLHWINTPSHILKTFVANRVVEIQNLTSRANWRYVPTADNPADALSRGEFPKQFVRNKLWHYGPEWLKANEDYWPKSPNIEFKEIPEVRKNICLSTTICIDWSVFNRFSSYNKLRRVMAYCLRWKIKKYREGYLKSEELENAEKLIIKCIQRIEFKGEYEQLQHKGYIDTSNKLLPLRPFIDKDGLLRVGGRLENAKIEYNQQHPILLPRGNHVTNIIIQDYHVKHYHAGIQTTLNILRQKFWVFDGRNQVRKIIRKCMTCFRANPPETKYVMGDLPGVRVNYARPFSNVGIDFCGPFAIKEKKYRNQKRIKVYIAVFICMAVKAIHLEVVCDLSTEGFIASLRRFIARRGLPANIYSDNGTNFVGANRELRELYALFNSNHFEVGVTNFASSKGIKWHFTPPRAPHIGGLWEAGVKLIKHHLKRIITDVLLTYDELETFVVEIEAIVNSRPLTPITNDPNDLQVLTPAHFLIGDNLQSLPDIDFSNTPNNRLSNWQHLQKIRQHFWERWHKEYLNELNMKRKWVRGTHSIKEGTVVLLKEDNTPTMLWRLGVVSQVHPGADGIIRVVTVKSNGSQFKRSVKGLAPLPIEE